jgi:HK97 family phage prohead protease
MSKFQTKDYGGSMVDVDSQSRKVKSVVAVFDNVDLDNDIILAEAVTKTIKEKGPKGKNLIWKLLDHNANLKSALGKPTELYVEGKEFFAVTPIVETDLGEDYLKLCEAGVINQFSIGFSCIKSTMQKETRIIQELKLYEYSPVLWGANPETRYEGIVKSEWKQDKKSLNDRLEKLIVSFKHGNFTDETFSLIEIEIKQIQKELEAVSTQPAIVAVEPQIEQKGLIEALSQFNQALKNI